VRALQTTPGTFGMFRRALFIVSLSLFAGCAVSHKTAVKPPAVNRIQLSATKQDLIARFNSTSGSVTSLTATANLQLTAGSSYSGVIEQYHEVKSFILASRPADIRVIGQAPVVGKDIFDMVSDAATFEIFIPSKNEFVTGPVNFDRKAVKPVENLRPQHVLDALFWQPISADSVVLLEQSDEPPSQYVLIVARPLAAKGSSDWELAQKIWFDRSDLTPSRIESYGEGGAPISDIRVSDWQPAGDIPYPRQILLARPTDDYQLQISITKLTLNEPIAPDKFHLAQPEGSKLVRVGPQAQEPQP